MRRALKGRSTTRVNTRGLGARAVACLTASLLAGIALVPLASGPGTASASPLPGAPGCQVLPSDNVWNTPVANLPVDPRSAQYIASIGAAAPLHPDFGKGDWDGEPMGIPYNVVPGTQPKVPVTFQYSSESNPALPGAPGRADRGGAEQQR